MIQFSKYEGAGNDFVIIDDRKLATSHFDEETIRRICDRHFGVGADGLMLLRDHPSYDFEMVYFNSDGRTSSMCGNGGRCIVAFARRLELIQDSCSFIAIDGPHEARFMEDGQVDLHMVNVLDVEELDGNSVLVNTGSPHVIVRGKRLDTLDLVAEARSIRYNDRFREQGVNVNFVESGENELRIRTYERGVENETLACGTGVVAAAVAEHHWGNERGSYHIKAVGGDLQVRLKVDDGSYTHIWKKGPVNHVFDGTLVW